MISVVVTRVFDIFKLIKGTGQRFDVVLEPNGLMAHSRQKILVIWDNIKEVATNIIHNCQKAATKTFIFTLPRL